MGAGASTKYAAEIRAASPGDLTVACRAHLSSQQRDTLIEALRSSPQSPRRVIDVDLFHCCTLRLWNFEIREF